jgi:diacylglycerol kinase family enzyme
LAIAEVARVASARFLGAERCDASFLPRLMGSGTRFASTAEAVMRAIVLTNPKAGAKADVVDELRRALADAGVEADVRAVPGEQLEAAARDAAAGGAVVIAAGGDGTVSAVAAGVRQRGGVMGVLPTGTLNHFARDVGVPLTLAGAAAVIAAGNVVAVDVAEVNGQPFVNNGSIGLYPRIVGKRDEMRQRLGRGKFVAMILAAIAVFRRYPTVTVRIAVGDRYTVRTTPFGFIGNNRYEISLTMLGRRQRLTGGELSLYFAHRTGRFGLLMLAARAVLGRLKQARDFEAHGVTDVWIDTPKKTLRVALDGEVRRLVPPLHFSIRPGALKVLAPPGAGAAASIADSAAVNSASPAAAGANAVAPASSPPAPAATG